MKEEIKEIEQDQKVVLYSILWFKALAEEHITGMGEEDSEKKGWWRKCFSSCLDYESFPRGNITCPNMLKITMYDTH